ncbi:MAG: hypothetical protein KAS32_19085 [Candidatus Peribacteraceae bacterium]|nr:hypothetical protein [Candidatus Peribacteraceae bacterium]
MSNIVNELVSKIQTRIANVVSSCKTKEQFMTSIRYGFQAARYTAEKATESHGVRAGLVVHHRLFGYVCGTADLKKKEMIKNGNTWETVEEAELSMWEKSAGFPV